MQDTHTIDELERLIEESLQQQNKRNASKQRPPNRTLSPYTTPYRNKEIKDLWEDKVQFAVIEEVDCKGCLSVEKRFIGWYLCRFHTKNTLTELKATEYREDLLHKLFVVKRNVGECIGCVGALLPTERATLSDCSALTAFLQGDRSR